MITVRLKARFDFVAGHKLARFTFGKEYPIISPGPHTKTVEDDGGSIVHLSRTAVRLYFHITDRR